IVLDNTYLTRASRSYVVEAASRHGAAARCVWLDTPLAQAQVNLVERLLDRFGSLPPLREPRGPATRAPAVGGPAPPGPARPRAADGGGARAGAAGGRRGLRRGGARRVRARAS